VKVPSTPRSRAASRANAFKHGGRAEVVTPLDVQRERLRRISPDAPEIIESYAAQLSTGDTSGVDALTVAALTETELMRRETYRTIREKGELIKEAVIGPDGNVRLDVVKLKANPLMEHARWQSEHVGATADQMRLSRKSGGEGAVNDALAKRLARNAMLMGADPDGLPAPAPRLSAGKPPIETELVQR
ncbi:MAG: hypothetical protein M3547_00210, partial [Acidobacteriota bacterium]|nr:hypothetical protein [Acidobacteriota bacterium]